MMKFRPCPCNLCFFLKPRRNLTSCPLPLESPVSSISATPVDHKGLCFSLAEQLIGRGLVSSAQRVVQRIISQCSSVSETMSALDFSMARGVELDSRSYSFLIRKLVVSGEAQLAEAFYLQHISGGGIQSDVSLLNSMIFCYSELGKLDKAELCFDKLMGMKSMPCTGACNAFIKQFCVQGREMEGYEYFVKISDADVLLSFVCYNRLVDNLSHRGYLDEALYVFDVMCNSGVSPTVHLCKSLVIRFCKRGRVEEAELLGTEMESYGLVLDKVMYTSLIDEYCRKKKIKMAMRLFLRMLKLGCDPDTCTYNTLIHGFVSMGVFDKAWVLHNMMAESRLKPDVVTYQIMISKYCKDQKVDCGLTLLNNMIHCNMTPSIHCYTVLVDALYKENRLWEINQLYNKMLDCKLVPDDVLFLTLVKNHPKGSEIELALTLIQAIARNGCGLGLESRSISSNFKSTADTMLEIEHLLEEIVRINSSVAEEAFSICLIAFCHGGKLDAAFLCIEKMVALGFLPRLTAYNSLIKGLYQQGLAEDVKSLIEVMQDQGLVPDPATFLIMVTENCKRGDFKSTFDLLEQMEEIGVKSNVAIYDSIISHLGRDLRVYEAELLFNRMLENGIEPDERIYATMINAYSKSGWATKAHKVFEKMLEDGVPPSSYSYTALINGLIKKNMTEKGCLYIDRMLEEGIMPNAAFYTALINQFLRKRELEFAFRLVDLMEKSQVEKDLVTYITLLTGVCRNIRCIKGKWYISHERSNQARETLFNLLYEKTLLPKVRKLKVLIRSQEEIKFFALKLIHKMKNSPFMPNLYLYNGMIYGFCWAQRMWDAYSYLDLMQREGVLPNKVTFTILIDGHMRFGETDVAVRLFNKMNTTGFAPDRILYDILIRGFCKVGRFLDALSVSHMMSKRGFSPSRASYENILSCFSANYLSGDALKMVEDMLGHGYIPCLYNLNWLTCLLYEENKLDEARMVHDLVLLKKRSSDTQDITMC